MAFSQYEVQEFIGNLHYEDFIFPCKLSYSLNGGIKIEIFDTKSFHLKDLLVAIYGKGNIIKQIDKPDFDDKIYFSYKWIESYKVYFKNLKFDGRNLDGLVGWCEYCIFLKKETTDLNRLREISFEVKDIDERFWKCILRKTNILEYTYNETSTLSIHYEYNFDDFFTKDFSYSLFPQDNNRNERYVNDSNKINQSFQSYIVKFLDENNINKSDITPNPRNLKIRFKLQNTSSFIEDMLKFLKFFQLISGSFAIFDKITLLQGQEVVGYILYSYYKKSPQRTVQMDFNFISLIQNNITLFDSWFKLISDSITSEVLNFIFIIMNDERYYPNFVLMECISAIECLQSKDSSHGSKTNLYIKDFISTYGTDELIVKIAETLFDSKDLEKILQNADKIKKLSNKIGDELGGRIRNTKAHMNTKKVKDIDLNNKNTALKKGLIEFLIIAIKSYLYHKSGINNDFIKSIIDCEVQLVKNIL